MTLALSTVVVVLGVIAALVLARVRARRPRREFLAGPAGRARLPLGPCFHLKGGRRRNHHRARGA